MLNKTYRYVFYFKINEKKLSSLYKIQQIECIKKNYCNCKNKNICIKNCIEMYISGMYDNFDKY